MKKWAKKHAQTLFQRRHPDVNNTNEKMLNITNHQGNANQNHTEISLHTYQNGQNQKHKKQVLVRI